MTKKWDVFQEVSDRHLRVSCSSDPRPDHSNPIPSTKVLRGPQIPHGSQVGKMNLSELHKALPVAKFKTAM